MSLSGTNPITGLPYGAKIKPDPIPKISTAGKVFSTNGQDADQCIRQDTYPLHQEGNSGTPEAIRRFRKSTNNEPGKIVVHHGLVNDPKRVPVDHAYGKATYGSEHVGQVIKAQNLSGLADKFNDIKEGKYASQVREPLAKGYERKYDWPSQAEGGKISFGRPTQFSENSKDLLYPTGGDKEEKQANAAMYRKTHGNFAPGEQRDRGYDWNLDKNNHAFGYGEQKLLNGASKSIHAERTDNAFPKTVIVKKTVEDMKSCANDQLGQTKNLGQGLTKEILEQRTFGISNNGSTSQWNAAKCINGDPSARELLPDADLGKSNKPNCSNNVRRAEDVHRSFGAPSIRTDIPMKTFKSVADYQNYGDEPEAVDLLFPQTFTELGVSETDFAVLRDREQIKTLFEGIGYSYKIGKFNAIYNRAKEINQVPQGEDQISVRAFMHALNEMHHIE